MNLSTRIEQAGEGSRELDAEIATELFLPWDYGADWGSRGHEKPTAYPYTTSLDAAMTLARHDGEAFVMLSDAMIALEDVGWPKGEWAKTLPRYVCAAALRARGL